MLMTIALPYVLKDADRLSMLHPAEQDAYNARLEEVLGDTPLNHPRAVRLARSVQREVLEPLDQVCQARVTVSLLTLAVRAKYGQAMPRRDARLWTALQDRLDEDPAQLDVNAGEATWITELFTDKVLDAYPPDCARWVNLLDAEIARLRAALTDPAALKPTTE